MNRRNFVTVAALAAAARCPRAVEPAQPSRSGGDIVLGMSAAFRGPSRGLGIELYRGSMACFEDVNRNGGIQERRIVIKAYDDNYNPLPTIENTVRLVEQDEPLLLFGYVGTPTVTRMLPLLKLYSDRSIYLFFPFTGALPHRRPPYDEFVFNLRASYYRETAELVDQFVAIGRKRIAVYYQIDAYGRGGWDGVRLALARHKLRIAGEATYTRGTGYEQSFRAQIDILRKVEPDAIISVGAYAACAGFIRDARDHDWDVPIANISFVGSDSLLELLLETGRKSGQDYTHNLINSEVVPSYDRTGLPAVADYRKLMERYNPMPPADLVEQDYKPLPLSYVGFEGFLNARLLVAILRKMKAIERDRLKHEVESVTRLDLGIDVPVSFGHNQHQGLDRVYLVTVEDGRFVQIEDLKKWRP
jgi:ABC-type branched-subunit amino acid transport system substrate-binding protein